MPRGVMDDLEGEVVGEEIHEGGFWEDMFSDDLSQGACPCHEYLSFSKEILCFVLLYK